MNKHYPYPSIGQFRDVVADAKHHGLERATFTGTVKVHGTQAAVILPYNKPLYCQSKNKVITAENDNYSFAAWVEDGDQDFEYIAETIRNFWDVDSKGDVVLFGEFAGKGIAKGTAANQAEERFFYIFEVVVTSSLTGERVPFNFFHLPPSPARDEIMYSTDPTTLAITVDFNHPEEASQALGKLTDQVSKHCPVGARLGVEGPGEGVVWTHISAEGITYRFKTKGEKFSTNKTKTRVPVSPEKLRSAMEFVKYAVTEARLEQAFEEACHGEVDRKHLGAFIRWLVDDIRKEESDVLKSNDLTMSLGVSGLLADKARTWFFEKERY